MKNFWNFRRASFNLPAFNHAIIFLLLFTTILLVSQSCNKEPSSIGLNLRDRDDLLGATFTDTTTLIAYSVLEDSLSTTNLVSNYLGYLKDNVFGAVTAGIYTQFIPSENNVDLDGAVLDSIVLTLRYTGGFYGDTLNPFAIKVYRLRDEISSTERYNQKSSIEHYGINLTYESDFRLYPTPTSRARLDTMLEPHVRIRLSDDLGNEFLEKYSQMATANSFKEFFKGLYICAEQYSGNGSLVNFTLTSALSGIQLYYKRGDGTPRRFSFIIRSPDAVRFNTYHHDHELGALNFVNQVVHKDTMLGKETLYVQAMGGVKTKITFPNLKALKDKRMVINKAELIITNIGEDLHLYPPPTRLTIYGVNAAGTNVFIRDDGTSYFGGNYDATKKEYRFRITRHVQDIILRDLQPSIYLVVAGAAANPNRLILNGTHPNNGTSRLRLEIYYTEY